MYGGGKSVHSFFSQNPSPIDLPRRSAPCELIGLLFVFSLVDEVSAIVLDLGSYTCKAGYAGEDAPKAVFPSVVGSIYQAGATDEVKHEKDSDSMYDSENADKIKTRKLYVGTQALGYRRDHMEVISPIKDGVVVDWDIVDNIWNHAFRERLLIDPKEHPMLLAEPSFNTPQQREKAAELMFESYKVPALFLAKNAVLTSFASGRATSLVVDSGGGSTTIAAVHDGYVLQKVIISFQKTQLHCFPIFLSSYISYFFCLFLLRGLIVMELSLKSYEKRVLYRFSSQLGIAMWLKPIPLDDIRTLVLFRSLGRQSKSSRAMRHFINHIQQLTRSKDMATTWIAVPPPMMVTTLTSRWSCLHNGPMSNVLHMPSKIQIIKLVEVLVKFIHESGIGRGRQGMILSKLLCKRSFTLNKGSLCSNSFYAKQAVSTSPIGGEFLTDCMMKSLESKGVMIKPRYSFKRKEIRPGEFQVVHCVYPATVVGLKIIYLVNYSTVDLDIPNTTESYKLYSQRAIASDIKESVCRVPDTAFEESGYANVPMTPYELPDGQTIEIGADRFKIPDVLFNPSLVQTIPGMESFAGSASVSGLPQMVIESINRCDADIKRELFSSILLAGGTASMLQLKERLEKELMEEAPQAARVKVLASGNSIERRFSVWIGGSILASLGSFQQLWFSKAEYEEHGVSNIQRKCP
ncbi:unnamed protein product [Musa acuminata var. zebrina]